MTDETCQQRNIRMGWGCKCHGETFCPDEICIGLEDDVPVFVRRDSHEGQRYAVMQLCLSEEAERAEFARLKAKFETAS